MGRLLLIVAGTTVTVALLILFLLLYRYATQDIEKDNTYIKNDTNRVDVINKPHASTRWIEELAQKKHPMFSFPVKEVQIELPLVKKTKISEIHRLTLRKMDDYKLFCIKQIFNNKNLPFALYSEKEQTVMVIRGIELSKLKKITKYVKSYGIDMQIENYEKRD